MPRFFVMLCALCALWLSGCQASQEGGAASGAAPREEVARLQSQVATLEKENAELKGELARLKTTVAPAPVAAASSPGGSAGTTSGAPVAVASPAGGAPPASPAGSGSKSFDDIQGINAEEKIVALAKLGVFDDEGPKFDPQKPLTRSLFVRWLVRSNNAIWRTMEKSNSLASANIIRLAEGTDQTFTDVSPSHVDYKYIQGMCNAGFVVGYDATTFKPDRLISREEMIAIKVGLDTKSKMEGGRLGQIKNTWGFTDTDKIADKYSGAIHWDANAGANACNITYVWGAIKTFHPQQAVTRAEAAWCCSRMGQYPSPTAQDALKELNN